MTDTDIAIVGGGIAGVTLAIGLLKRGINVKIYEQAPNFAEIGAGVSFGANAARAMDTIGGGVKEAYQKVFTPNASTENGEIWFNFVDGYHDNKEAGKDQEKWLFKLISPRGGGGVHRAHFLDELIKAVPDGVAIFNKRLETCIELNDGKMELCFHDGSTARHDAVIGCDGIKSRVRAILVGEANLQARPTYCHKYAYRGLIPMENATAILGADMAENAHMHLGPGGHILTFPVAQGKMMNVVAFRQDDSEWTDKRLTAPAHKKDAQRDYAEWHPNILAILDMLNDDLDRWAIFDLGEHPLASYCKGRVCLLGDAAHATSPHHGAGAGFCIEDSAVMSALIQHANTISAKRVCSVYKSLEAAFAAFDQSRRERTQWLVQSSRITGNLYDWMDPNAGQNKDQIYNELNERCQYIWNADIDIFTGDAVADLDQRVALEGGVPSKTRE
ncbi:hypothetical protein FH972_026031 [Carpinus fangiana]|uniref:FAD-binding domain-containing protein n=1 Tax=Carpinus fangiana TaxID=176857 RepID=A0A5N6L2R7_9ROSI|nr:hypothetical protein FH972_026031 [Carpinus fangiana]